jgi:hypothetical protein
MANELNSPQDWRSLFGNDGQYDFSNPYAPTRANASELPELEPQYVNYTGPSGADIQRELPSSVYAGFKSNPFLAGVDDQEMRRMADYNFAPSAAPKPQLAIGNEAMNWKPVPYAPGEKSEMARNWEAYQAKAASAPPSGSVPAKPVLSMARISGSGDFQNRTRQWADAIMNAGSDVVRGRLVANFAKLASTFAPQDPAITVLHQYANAVRQAVSPETKSKLDAQLLKVLGIGNLPSPILGDQGMARSDFYGYEGEPYFNAAGPQANGALPSPLTTPPVGPAIPSVVTPAVIQEPPYFRAPVGIRRGSM